MPRAASSSELAESLVGGSAPSSGVWAALQRDWNTLPPEGKAQMPLCAALFALGGLSATTWGRFAAVYYEQKSLSTVEIGLIAGVTPICQAFAIPLWGVLADKLKNKKGVFLFTKVFNTVALSRECFQSEPQIEWGGGGGSTALLSVERFVSAGTLSLSC